MAERALDVVTGAFSYTGRHIASRLLAAGREVRTLTGHPEREDPFGGRVLALPYRFDDPAAMARSLEGAETLYNTYWVRFARGGRSHDRAVHDSEVLFAAAAAAGVRRIVHVSITGADPASPLPYFRGKGRVEAALRACGPDFAIVRPTLVFGHGDVLLHNIAWALRRLPAFALFGDGAYPVQPVHVDDVAELAVRLGREGAGAAADAVGPETYTYRDLVARVAEAIGRRVPLVPLPPGLAWAGAAAVGVVVRDVVVTRDEIAGLMAGLLVSRQAPTGGSRLSEWLRANAPTLGLRWVSEIRRHYAP